MDKVVDARPEAYGLPRVKDMDVEMSDELNAGQEKAETNRDVSAEDGAFHSSIGVKQTTGSTVQALAIWGLVQGMFPRSEKWKISCIV